jgi:hypothetical protein
MTIVLPPSVSRQELLELAEKLRRIPDDARVYRRSVDWAWNRLRIRPELLLFLAEHGVPTQVSAGTARFDWHDVLNCAMQLGQGPVARAARRFWPVALRRADQGRPARYEVQYQTRCPAPEHEGPCEYVMALPGGKFHRQTTQPGGSAPGVAVVVEPRTTWPALPPAARAALDVAGELDFMLLPEKIRRDVDFLLRSRLGDCCGVALLLARELQARSVPARTSYGFIVTPPFAVEHYWAEALVDDVWVPVDPVLIRTMVRWGVLDPAEWHPYRSIGAILVRVAAEGVPTMVHNGVAVPFTLPTRLLTDGSAA